MTLNYYRNVRVGDKTTKMYVGVTDLHTGITWPPKDGYPYYTEEYVRPTLAELKQKLADRKTWRKLTHWQKRQELGEEMFKLWLLKQSWLRD